MSLFGEFRVPADAFALSATLRDVPEAVIEIERVVAVGDVLTPYFWVSGADPVPFEDALRDDPSVSNCRRLDEFDEATLYRADWTANVETIAYAYDEMDAVILEAIGEAEGWTLRLRFDDRGRLDGFREYCEDRGVSFDLRQLYEIAHPHSAGRYGLTDKQYEALDTAWEMGYFELPRAVDLADVAAELGISQQALSDRLRRAHDALVANTIRITPTSNVRS